jgi:hypothetical protein
VNETILHILEVGFQSGSQNCEASVDKYAGFAQTCRSRFWVGGGLRLGRKYEKIQKGNRGKVCNISSFLASLGSA